MIYLVFTPEGFEQAKKLILEDQATVWINESVLTEEQKQELTIANIDIFTLPTAADPSNEKSVLAALEYVERKAPDCEIFVEYL